MEDMKVKRFGEEIKCPIVLVLGFFDCVHIGHRAVIAAAKRFAKSCGAVTAVFTFTNNPLLVLGKDIPLICTFSERCERLRSAGADIVLGQQFSPDFAAVEPLDFLASITSTYSTVGLFCGGDYAFGRGGAGTPETLRSFCAANGIHFEVPSFIYDSGEKVSSTAIRRLLSGGRAEEAARLMGAPFTLSGTVRRGHGMGIDLDCPTANIAYPQEKVQLRSGVYATAAEVAGIRYAAVTNIGCRPTFGDHAQGIETHIIADNILKPLYGERITVDVLSFMREARVFASAEQLALQLKKDKEARKLI